MFKETVMQGAAHPGTKLKVMQSAAGYYLGFAMEGNDQPYSRETVYFGDRGSAEQVLKLFRI